MKHQPLITSTILAAAALLLTAPAAADDKDFLREVSAAPNLIFILDTSSSMVLSPEVTLAGDPPAPASVNGALVSAGNVPGGGDDPYSRKGIAKRVPLSRTPRRLATVISVMDASAMAILWS